LTLKPVYQGDKSIPNNSTNYKRAMMAAIMVRWRQSARQGEPAGVLFN
jgi:hypothetical protein